MWTTRSEKLSDVCGIKCAPELDGRPATFAEVLDAWRLDGDFRSLLSSLLRDAPFDAFRWETPPVTTDSVSQPFEFVLLDSPGLARQPDSAAFAKHFSRAVDGVSVFPNLGGDAIMIVPCPLAPAFAYGHLAAFVRLAPESQQHALWQAVGAAMTRRVSRKPVWLSTAGAGVSWLHVRLDDRPKYYGYATYRKLGR